MDSVKTFLFYLQFLINLESQCPVVVSTNFFLEVFHPHPITKNSSIFSSYLDNPVPVHLSLSGLLSPSLLPLEQVVL